MTAKEIAAFLSEEIKEVTGASEVLVTSQLVTLGLDSFGFVELGGRIKKHFGIEVNSVKMSPDMTIEDVSEIIYKLQVRPYTRAHMHACIDACIWVLVVASWLSVVPNAMRVGVCFSPHTRVSRFPTSFRRAGPATRAARRRRTRARRTRWWCCTTRRR